MKNLKEVKQLWEKEFETFVKDNLIEGSKGLINVERKNSNDLIVSHNMTDEKVFAFADSFMDKYNVTEDEFELVLDSK